MKYVYLLQSLSHPDQRYIGMTADIAQRLAAHNAGQSTHTLKYLIRSLVPSGLDQLCFSVEKRQGKEVSRCKDNLLSNC